MEPTIIPNIISFFRDMMLSMLFVIGNLPSEHVPHSELEFCHFLVNIE
jgi:hypothetical protein